MCIIGGVFQGLGLADMFGSGREQGVDVFELVEEKNNESLKSNAEIKEMINKVLTNQSTIESKVERVDQATQETEHMTEHITEDTEKEHQEEEHQEEGYQEGDPTPSQHS